ncbi:MAG TPA: helix-turn-helix transcriptional regulator [Chloroflexota bacterium]|jgi:DNA-binding PadR family transcriptional regulator
MPESSLSSSAYVVLGLLATYGSATPYDLKRWVDASIGYFWSFPRAQLYVEPERLARLGLLTERREGTGRHRRVFSLTDAGREALQGWIRSSDSAPVELRDPGLLKLFFGGAVTPADVLALARGEQAHHAARLAEYERIRPQLEANPDAAFGLATIRLGVRHEQVAVDFWREIAEDPSALPRAGARRIRRAASGARATPTTSRRTSAPG